MNVAWKRKFTASATTQFPADLLCKGCEYCGKCCHGDYIDISNKYDSSRGKPRHQYQYRVCPTFAPEKKIETVVKKEDIVLKPIFSEANYTDDDGSWACEKKILCSRKGKMKTSFLYYSLGAPSPKENNLVYRLER
ncbi:hypothetical protein OUZ56_023081 [Daphnia magna]|uniref:Uncharacterized protein n=1 Tax=Daphnia magna TaxID=35525 RepID=A0ABR0AYC9_9CRUS|nr:hypothetical protein OUZ56_023081 [Daphnia magna]